MQNLNFTLPIVPTAQARPKHTRAGHAYKTSDQRTAERTLEAMLAPYMPESALDGPLEVTFTAWLPVPASASKRARAAMLASICEGCIVPETSPLPG